MRSSLVLGTAAVAVTASLATTVAAMVAPAGQGGGLLGGSTAAAAELEPFEDCSALLDWYVAQALPLVGPWGLGGPGPVPYAELDGAVRQAPTATEAGRSASAEDAATSSDTGTTVQETGVDEPDVAKTDGSIVVRLRGRVLLITDVSGEQPRTLGRLSLPRELALSGDAGLLLLGDRVLIVSGSQPVWAVPDWPVASDIGARTTWPAASGSTRVLEVSLADPAEPRVVSDRTYGGTLLAARQYAEGEDTTVRVVLSTVGPTLDFVEPNRNRTEKEATEENRRIVAASTLDDWLPSVRSSPDATDGTDDSGSADPAPLVACQDVLHPTEDAGFGTLTMLTLADGDPAEVTSTAVTATAETVYSSADRLYLATLVGERKTQVHAFALEPGTTAYTASGTVRGTVRDRWSLDEHDGVLRMAVAYGPLWDASDNGVVTLRESDRRLTELGSVRGMGRNEEITAVRWFDDLAILVTFRQTDPVFTVDLADPASPRRLGELKIPGFSEYLHPIGADRLVGVGQDATKSGEVRGGQVSVFDVADLTSPRRLGALSLGRMSWPSAGSDPRTFTWIPAGDGQGWALTAVEDGRTGRTTIVEVRVAADGSLTRGRTWSLDGHTADAREAYWGWAGSPRALPLPDGRVALVGWDVQVVDVG